MKIILTTLIILSFHLASGCRTPPKPKDLQAVDDCLNGYDLLEEDNSGWTMLYRASRYNNSKCVETILQQAKEKNVLQRMINKGTNSTNETPLFTASFYGYTKIVEELLSHEAEVDKKKDDGSTPLGAASYNGHLPSVELLLQYGADVNEPENDGVTPLLFACQKGNLKVVQHLINNNANLFWKAKYNADCAYRATQNGHLEILKFILPSTPTLIKRRLYNEFTILHIAAQNNHYDVTEFILSFQEAESILNDKSNKFSDTSLTLAIHEDGDLDLVKLLILKGADPHLTGYRNKTPLEFAEEENKDDIAEYIRNL